MGRPGPRWWEFEGGFTNFKNYILSYLYCFGSQGEDRGALVVSLCQQPLAGQLAVIILKAERLPHPKPDSATAIGQLCGMQNA